MLTERLSKTAKFQQNTEQSEEMNHEAKKNTSRKNKTNKDTENLNNITNNFELNCL